MNNYMNNMLYNTPPYMGYTQPYMAYQQQNRQQNQPNIQEYPVNQVVYGTLDQAKGHIAGPNTSIVFVDTDKSEAYIRKADALGKQALETYKYCSLDKSLPDAENKPMEPDFFVKREELKDFLTRKDLEDLYSQIDNLKKRVKLNNIIEEVK